MSNPTIRTLWRDISVDGYPPQDKVVVVFADGEYVEAYFSGKVWRRSLNVILTSTEAITHWKEKA